MGLLSGRAEVGRCAAAGEVASEDWLEEGAEDDLSAAVHISQLESGFVLVITGKNSYLVCGSAIQRTRMNLKV